MLYPTSPWFDLEFPGHSLVFYITRHTKRIKKQNNNSRFRKAQRPSGSFIKYFYFSLYDIGMARKSAHRFGFHDFHNFKALNACAAR